MTKSSKTAKRTQRLIDLLNHEDVCVNWSDALADSNGWKIIYATIVERNVIILDMQEYGYQLYTIDTFHNETTDEEVKRLAMA